MSFLENKGYCPICESETIFIANESYLRNHYRCSNCGTLPRQRALMCVLQRYFPLWRELCIHESSPSNGGASGRIKRECKNHIPSQYWPTSLPGAFVDGVRCENLEALSFKDESIDLHITQDVLEHVFHPKKAFSEIARTLRPGGAHIFTVPLVMRRQPSRQRAKLNNANAVKYLLPAQYHGNPISKDGSLVTIDWGFDICKHIFDSCGLFTYVIEIDDISKGIRAELNEVLITVKPKDTLVNFF